GGDVGFLACDRRAHFGDAIDVLLVVLFVALPLGLAVVELLLQRRQAILFTSELVLQDAPRVAVPRALGRRVDARRRAGSRRGPGARLRHLDHRDRLAHELLATEPVGFLGGGRVLVVVARARIGHIAFGG